MERLLAAGLAASLLVGSLGCSTTREIETAPPTPAVAAPDQPSQTVQRALLTVLVETGTTALPAEAQALRFRLDEVLLKVAGDTAWTSLPADANRFEIRPNLPERKRVLLAQPPPAAYDSLALTFSDVFISFDANAGGPLTLPREAPIHLALPFRMAPGERTTIRLTFEPGASLSRTPDCRWLFLPFFTARVE